MTTLQSLCEVRQKLYTNGSRVGQGAVQSIDFRPGGFGVVKVLSGDLSEVAEPNEAVNRGQGTWPEKTTFHLDVSRTPSTSSEAYRTSSHLSALHQIRDPTYDQPFKFRDQQRVKKGPKGYPTRRTLAIFVAKEIKKALVSECILVPIGTSTSPCSAAGPAQLRAVSLPFESTHCDMC